MKRFRGVKLGRRIVKLFKWIIRARKKPTAVMKFLSLASHIRRGAKQICCLNRGKNYIQLGETRPVKKVNKGLLAVYVGESDDEAKRVMVPVIYFNHPLFGELLKKSEDVYGFDHPGGITIPCRISEFEKVKMRIDSWNRRPRRRMLLSYDS